MSRGGELPRRDAAVVDALRKLGYALRSRRMYPESSPVLQRALVAASEGLRRALEGSELIVDILPQELRWLSMDGETLLEPQQEIASRLHRHRISRLRIDSQFTDAALSDLLASMLLDPETAMGPHPLLQDAFAGFAGQSLELGGIYSEGGSAVDHASIWDQVLDGYVAASNSGPMGWADVAREPEALAGLLQWSLDPTQQHRELTQYSQTDLFGLILEQVAAASAETPERTLENVSQAIARLQRQVDPEVWLELLAEPLNVALGQGSERVHVDLSAVISRALSAGELEELVQYSVRSRRHATPRLYRFFQRAVGDRPDATSIARQVLNANPRCRSDDFADAWPGFVEALTGENIEPYVKADYRAALDSAIGVSAPANCWDAATIRRRLAEMDPDHMRLAMSRVAHALLGRERDDLDYQLLLEGTLRGLPAILRQQDAELLEAIASTLVRHAGQPDRSAVQRDAAEQGVQRLREPEFMQGLVALLARGEGGHFHALWRVVDLLGSSCLPFVLDAMAQSPTPAYRHHLARILQQTPEIPVELLAQRLSDSRAAYVRDLVLVLSEMGREEAFGLLEQALAHEDSSVRRAALVGLTRYPADRVEPHLIEALSDAALEVRVAALRGFRELYADRSQEHLIRYLRLTNWTGRNTRVITAAVKALAGLGDQNALVDLGRLARRPLLFRQRRMAVAHAARESIAAIRRRLEAKLRDSAAAPESESQTIAA